MSGPPIDAFARLMLAQRRGKKPTPRRPDVSKQRLWYLANRPRPKPCPWSVPFIYPEDVKPQEGGDPQEFDNKELPAFYCPEGYRRDSWGGLILL
jgi:hypothetical protein